MWSLKHWFSRLTAPDVQTSHGVADVDIAHVDNEAIVIEAIKPGKTGWISFRPSWWSSLLP